MGDNTHHIPDTHKEMKSPFYGVTASGLSFEIDTQVTRKRINTVEFANKMMNLRIQAAAEARQKGLGFGRMRYISDAEVETHTEITLRVAAPGKVYRVELEDLGNGHYYARNFFMRGNLRDVTREVVKEIGTRHGVGMGYAEPQPAAGGFRM